MKIPDEAKTIELGEKRKRGRPAKSKKLCCISDLIFLIIILLFLIKIELFLIIIFTNFDYIFTIFDYSFIKFDWKLYYF